MNTYDILYNKISISDEDFINRTEVRDIITSYYARFNVDGANMFKVFYIYGFGGMGKTCLVNYFKRKFLESIPEKRIIHITFEIQENSQMLYSLIKLRKAFNHSCPIFDYSLLYYWDLERIERLNDDFLKLIKTDVISSYIDLGLEFPFFGKDIITPSFADIQNVINTCYQKINSNRVKSVISELKQMQPGQILENLPLFLADDMKSYMQRKNVNYIFLFDAYKQSIPYSESDEWLLQFINVLQKGLYIITGREKLHWKPNAYKIKEFHLDIYPEDDARAFLQRVIPDSRKDILDTIIKTSGCIPIYVALSYDLYIREQEISTDDLIKKSKFTDRASLVRHFINHLNKNWQDIIIYLAVVRIFNSDIFDFLITNLNLPCSSLDFDEIIHISLFKYIENSNELYKLHDVFCENAISVLPENTIDRIFSSYLSFLSRRQIYRNLINQTLDSAVTLFINVVELCIKYSQQIKLDSKKSENIIDMFLVLSDTRIIFPIPKPSNNYSVSVNDFLYFMDAIMYEKVNTFETINKLKKIQHPELFGKHFKSYNIIKNYENSLNGNYKPLKNYLEELSHSFQEDERSEWYYLKTLIYLSDYYMMEGEFVKSYACLENLRASVSLEIYHTDNYFLLERSIGHIYRFNYDFEKACNIYEELLNKYNDNPSLKVYLLVNMCETKCFIEPYYVINKFDEALAYVNQFQNLKNKAKLYYSRGIANALLHKYQDAYSDIETSIQINQKDGYRSGELFAYQAKTFCEYGETGNISADTINNINEIINSIGVYHFLLYPINMINHDPAVEQVNWIDENITRANCMDFIKRLRS